MKFLLVDAAQRFAKALKWSTATSDVDQDPLIIDLDGDGRTLVVDAANDNHLSLKIAV
jgi:hypothetical protein